MVRKLGVPAGVVINRFDLGDRRVEDFCARQQLPVLGRIPFDRKLAEAYAQGRTAVADLPGWRDRFSALGREILERASGGRRPRISDVSHP
jgi:MinD superfamily P-loop ATPase